MPLTPCWAVLTAFEGRIEAAWDGAFVRGSLLVRVARNSSKRGRDRLLDCWVLHASPERSAAHQDLARHAAAGCILRHRGIPFDQKLPLPKPGQDSCS